MFCLDPQIRASGSSSPHPVPLSPSRNSETPRALPVAVQRLQTSAFLQNFSTFVLQTFRGLHSYTTFYRNNEGEIAISGNVTLFSLCSGAAISILTMFKNPRFALCASAAGLGVALVSRQYFRGFSEVEVRGRLNRLQQQLDVDQNESLRLHLNSTQHPESLIQRARQGLENPTNLFDYHAFSRDTEVERSHPFPSTNLDQNWQHFISKASTEVNSYNDPVKKLRAVVRELNRFFPLARYTKTQNNRNNYLMGESGNCEARAWLIISAIRALNISLPDHLQLGVQIFGKSLSPGEGHVQAVLYNRQSGEVLDLLTGRKTSTVLAPIYKDRILIHAYLARDTSQHTYLSAHPSASLILEPASANARQSMTPDTPPVSSSEPSLSEFPENNYVYPSTAPESEVTELNFDDLNERVEQQESISVGAMSNEFSLYYQGFNWERRDSFGRPFEDTCFSRRSDAQRYAALSNAEERRSFLFELERESVNHALRSPVLNDFLSQVHTLEDFRYFSFADQDLVNVLSFMGNSCRVLETYKTDPPQNEVLLRTFHTWDLLQQNIAQSLQRDPFSSLEILVHLPGEGGYFIDPFADGRLGFTREQEQDFAQQLIRYFQNIESNAPYPVPFTEMQSIDEMETAPQNATHQNEQTALRLKQGLSMWHYFFVMVNGWYYWLGEGGASHDALMFPIITPGLTRLLDRVKQYHNLPSAFHDPFLYSNTWIITLFLKANHLGAEALGDWEFTGGDFRNKHTGEIREFHNADYESFERYCYQSSNH